MIFSLQIRPACLPKDTTKTYAGEDSIVSGWGRLSTNAEGPNKLHSVGVKVMTNEVCNNKWGNGITKEMLCAADTGKDSCEGDSGGETITVKFPQMKFIFFLRTPLSCFQAPHPHRCGLFWSSGWLR